MGYFILYAEQQVSSQSDAASAPAIEGALQGVLGLQNSSCGIPINGSWVGSPRVTRQASLTITGNGRLTRVAWLFTYPDGPTPSVVENCIRTIADYQLSVMAGIGWQPATILPYVPALNGSVAWWSSPQGAAATHTQNAFDLNQQTGGTSTIENPTGPQLTTGPNDLSVLPTGGGSPLTQANSLLITAAVVGAGGVLLYLLWPVLSGVRAGSQAVVRRASSRRVPARNNPSRRRHHSRHRHPITASIIPCLSGFHPNEHFCRFSADFHG